MDKRALAVISFGTTREKSRKSIDKLEGIIAAEMEGYDVYRAFTSAVVARRIKEREGITIPSPEQLMEQLLSRGYTSVLCQSLHIIPGDEYDKMVRQLMPYSDKFKSFAIGRPLLNEIEDYDLCCDALIEYQPEVLDTDEAVVYMGHGSEHQAGAAYSQMENMFRAKGRERIYIGTVEGFPDREYVLGRLKKNKVKRVYLSPMMIVSGEHVENDMLGKDSESWKSVLEGEGFEVKTSTLSLGDMTGIGKIFAEHACRCVPE